MKTLIEPEKLLMHAVNVGDAPLTRQLLQTNPDIVNCRGHLERTPLHLATTVEVARILLQHGADLNLRDYDDDEDTLPEQRQAWFGNYEVAEFLAHCRKVGVENGSATFRYTGKIRRERERRKEELRRACMPSGSGTGPRAPHLGDIGKTLFLMRHMSLDRTICCSPGMWYTYAWDGIQALRDKAPRGEQLNNSLSLRFQVGIPLSHLVHVDGATVQFPAYVTNGLQRLAHQWRCTAEWKVIGFGVISVSMSQLIGNVTLEPSRTNVMGNPIANMEHEFRAWQTETSGGRPHYSPARYIGERLARVVTQKDAKKVFTGNYLHTFHGYPGLPDRR